MVNHPAVDETWPWIPEEVVPLRGAGWGDRQGVSTQGGIDLGYQGRQGGASGMSRKVFLQRQTLLKLNQEKGGGEEPSWLRPQSRGAGSLMLGPGLCGFSGERISVSERGPGATDLHLLCAGGRQDLRGEVHGPGRLSSALGGRRMCQSSLYLSVNSRLC